MRGTQFAQLTAFVAVAEHSSFTRAALQLGISTPSLSQTIRSLEEHFGVRLLNRTTRSVALTEAGEELLGKLNPVIEGLHSALDAVNALRGKEKFLVGQTPFLAPFREDPVRAAEASDRLRREINGIRTKIEAEQESLERLMRRPGGAESDAENLEALEEAIATEEEALRREERLCGALLVALEVLRDSVLDYQKEHVARLAQVSGRTLGHLTRGRYSQVTLDTELNPTVRLDGAREIPVEALSHGARDAFYFALRAALAQELAAREPLPLLLDDPTAHFDEERRGSLVGHLEDLAKDLQVILLTHDRRILNQVREAHVLKIGTEGSPTDSTRKIQIRR